jgi:hypothetical protein
MAAPGISRLVLAVVAAGLVGAGAATGVFWGAHRLRPPAADLHVLLHQVVPLDAAEEGRLDLKEKAFAARRDEISERMRTANARLSAAIQSDPRWSPEVDAISREVESAAGDLQRATLEHVFEMREGLDPAHRKAYDDALVAALNRGAR